MTGCLAQRYKQEIIDEIPEVDGILGTSTYDEISHVLAEALGGKEHVQCFHDLDGLPELENGADPYNRRPLCIFKKLRKGATSVVLTASFPSLRGNYRSVSYGTPGKGSRKAGG